MNKKEIVEQLTNLTNLEKIISVSPTNSLSGVVNFIIKLN